MLNKFYMNDRKQMRGKYDKMSLKLFLFGFFSLLPGAGVCMCVCLCVNLYEVQGKHQSTFMLNAYGHVSCESCGGGNIAEMGTGSHYYFIEGISMGYIHRNPG